MARRRCAVGRAGAREVAEEAAGERVARAGRIEDLLEREAGREEDESPVNRIAPCSPFLTMTMPGRAPGSSVRAQQVVVAGQLARLAVVDHQQIHALEQP
jgi:hypothetical protein